MAVLCFAIAGCNEDLPEQITVSFDTDGGTPIEDIVFNKGDTLTLPPAPEKEGYIFDGWTIDGLTEDTDLSAYILSGNITLKAKWKLQQFTYVFKNYDGSELMRASADRGSTINAPQLNPQKPADNLYTYTFSGWDKTLPHTLTADVTFIAQFTSQKKFYTVTLNTNGGTDLAPISQQWGTSLTLPTPERRGCTFLGWYEDVDLSEEISLTEMPAQNVQVWAAWYSFGLDELWTEDTEQSFNEIWGEDIFTINYRVLGPTDDYYGILHSVFIWQETIIAAQAVPGHEIAALEALELLNNLIDYAFYNDIVIICEMFSIGCFFDGTAVEDNEAWYSADGETLIRYNGSSALFIVPAEVKYIGAVAFMFTAVEVVEFETGSALIRIGLEAFANCEYLYEITLPETLEYIGLGAFWRCSDLEYILIPAAVQYVGPYAFDNIPIYRDYGYEFIIYCAAEEQPEGWNDDWNLADSFDPELPRHNVVFGVGSVQDLETLFDESLFREIWKKDLFSMFFLWGYDFYEEVDENDLFLDLYQIYTEGYFIGAASVKNGNMNDVLAALNAYALWPTENPVRFVQYGDSNILYMESLQMQEYFEDTLYREKYAYYTSDGQTLLKYVGTGASFTVPARVKTIAPGAFADNDTLLTVNFQTGSLLETISLGAFMNCVELREISLPDGIKTIEEYAFAHCQYLNAITLHGSLEYVGNYAFMTCIGLYYVVISSGIDYLGKEVFYGITSMVFGEDAQAPEGWHEDWDLIDEYAPVDNRIYVLWDYLNIEFEFVLMDGDTTLRTISAVALWQAPAAQKDGFFLDGWFYDEEFNDMVCFPLFTDDEYPVITIYAKFIDYTSGLYFLDEFTYYMLIGYDGIDRDLVIPATHNGLPVEIPTRAVYYDDEYFSYLIRSIRFANGITKIDEWAFDGNLALQEVYIPASVTTIGEFAFVADNTVFYCEAASMPEGWDNNWCSGENYRIIWGCDFDAEVTYTFMDGETQVDELTAFSAVQPPALEPGAGKYLQGWSLEPDGELVPFPYYSIQSVTLYAVWGDSFPDLIFEWVEDYDIFGYHVHDYYGTDSEVYIPDTYDDGIHGEAAVIAIEEYVFYWNRYIERVHLPSGLLYIGEYAFTNSSLSQITLPEGLKVIHDSAFEWTLITEIYIPASVEDIDTAFAYCYNLQSVVFGGAIEELNESAFYECQSLVDINLPEGLKYIGYNAFYNCRSLAPVVIPFSVVDIDSYAFDGPNILLCRAPYQPRNWNSEWCGTADVVWGYGLGTVKYTLNNDGILNRYTGKIIEEMPVPHKDGFYFGGWYDNPEFLGAPVKFPYYDSAKVNLYALWSNNAGTAGLIYKYTGSFYYVDGYEGTAEDVVIPYLYNGEIVQFISDAFTYNTTIKSVVIGGGVEYLYESFKYCTNLESVTFMSDLLEIGYEVFMGCTKLTSITLPSSLEFIGFRAFTESGLTHINIPASVYSLDDPFINCTALMSITVEDGNRYYFDIDGVLFGTWDGENYLLCYPAGRTAQSYTVPENTNEIGYYAFAYNTHLTSVTLPDNLDYIDYNAFGGCTNLAEVILPDSLECIGEAAFKDCTSLTEIILPAALKRIGSNAFQNSGLTQIFIPAACEETFGNPFIGCTNLTAITVDEANQAFISIDGVLYSVGDFYNALVCYPGGKLGASYTVPDEVSYIEDYAFTGTVNLETVYISENMANVDSYSFWNSSIKNIFVDENNMYYSDVDGVLYTYNQEMIIYYPAARTESSYTLAENVKIIGYKAFQNAKNLTSIVLNQGLTQIYSYGFSGSGITSIIIPISVYYIGDSIFFECESLTELNFEAASLNGINTTYYWNLLGYDQNGETIRINDDIIHYDYSGD